ncbi:Uncharacterized protein conserved in bacteria [Citrobacter werkmanii]|uniref:Uncharacterized protein conserved in bacteria n=1 Tax=Citrobacter werkmanii TaxID=67827 RepID=A0A9N8GTL2_9ENTR|nr:Uncharacterized protein conserved in bacteria [Citrobacter werkmanii]CAB5571822.1 Uncharacterized protein conserved in bacteria [Citrobacter werkmanii]CAB5582490.1 Uncharacterized protein conserved in bacteria [Citrobacter werkmanii]CAB5594926.1 Uncharacterized protein conserved in bacteria [Citrobacter werkmanii]CAB5601691.1 Uncharacterized protein conserved in bacteria [Citrobacter werkmanii]
MGDSFQNEVPTARVNIKLDLHTGGVQKKVELPLKLLTVGDFSNGREQRPLSEREKVDINKNNFNDVLAKEGANKRGNSSRLTQSFHFFMFEPIFSPVNALNQPI